MKRILDHKPSLWVWLRRIDKRTWGTVFIYIGVAVWFPYFYLLAAGQNVSLLPFLIVHLSCVLAGARLRADGSAKVASSSRETRLRLASRVLITLGVLAWAPYFYISRVQNIETELTPYLLAHLTGVLSGLGIRAYLELKKR